MELKELEDPKTRKAVIEYLFEHHGDEVYEACPYKDECGEEYLEEHEPIVNEGHA